MYVKPLTQGKTTEIGAARGLRDDSQGRGSYSRPLTDGETVPKSQDTSRGSQRPAKNSTVIKK